MLQLILLEYHHKKKQTYWKSREMHFNLLGLCRVLVLVSIICLLFLSTPAFAAERIVLKYGIFRESLSVKELSTFAQTAELSGLLKVNLALARQDPKAIRQYLTKPIKVNPVFLDKVLNSQIGNIILEQISQVISTPSQRANRQALRAALVLAANQDGQVSLIEIIKNYPTNEMEVDGDRLESAYRQLRRLQTSLQDLFGV
ncbi:alpha/beta hydrolase [Nostoc sp.]|uniref:alpha/beta hydrolase n=1 Tax=Nostoc sp. TaxID=1180 RepID=UPI003FA60DD2